MKDLLSLIIINMNYDFFPNSDTIYGIKLSHISYRDTYPNHFKPNLHSPIFIQKTRYLFETKFILMSHVQRYNILTQLNTISFLYEIPIVPYHS